MKRIVDIPEEMYDWLDNGFPTEDDYVKLWGKIRQGTTLEEEFKKIKTDILNLGFTGWADKPKLDREEVLTILNKYISALSGDNKQSRCNSCLNNTDELSGECYECVKGIEDWYEPISELKGE